MDQIYFLAALGAIASLAAIFSLIAMIKVSRFVSTPTLTQDVVATVVRSEGDHVRRAADENSRNARSELNGTLVRFQELSLVSFKSLGETLNSSLLDFGGRLDKGIEIIDKRVEGISHKLNDDLRVSAQDATKNRDALRQLIEGKLDDVISKQSAAAIGLRAELEASFQRLQARVTASLSESSELQKERLDGNTSAVNALSEKQETSLERLRVGVESRLDAIRQENATKLDEMRQTVDERLQSTLETRLGESFNRVVDQLKSIHEGVGEMKLLAANVGDLQKVLTNVKVRGTYGEVQLELLLEEFLSAEQYIKNAAVKDDTSERVEFAIRFPGKDSSAGVLLPVDAKFPREDYDNLVAASEVGDGERVAFYKKQLENRIRASAKDIHDKYINPPRTTDFGILFIPTESLYAEILRQPGLLESLQRDFRVTLASPTTFAALLSALQMGFKTLAIEKRSSEVWQILGAVRTEFTKYDEVVKKISKQLTTASSSVDNLLTRTRAVTRKLRGVDSAPDDITAANLLGLTNTGSDDIENTLDEDEFAASEINIPATLIEAEEELPSSPKPE
jgi:DNA recombination protein RmuC